MIEVNDKSNCCGCYACKNICPQKCVELKKDKEGFYYPHVNKGVCIACGLCESVCPIINKHLSNIIEDSTKGFYYINENIEIRKKSTSGGAFYEIAKKILDIGGVVYGAAFDTDFSVHHIRIDNLQEIDKLLGSKYVQSRLDGIFNDIKKDVLDNRIVLFSGTPCQVEAINIFFKRKYKNLVYVDIICHGVPSEEVWLKYLEQRKREYKSDIQLISFRDKENGWRNYNLKILFKNKKEYKKVFFEDPYLRCFIKDIILRPSCYSCKFKSVNRVSDMTLADFWGVWDLNKDMYDNWGTSFIMVHSEKGSNIVDSVLASAVECNIKEAIKYNPSVTKSVDEPQNREAFFNTFERKNIIKMMERYSGITNRMRIKRIIKRLIGR